MLAMRSPEIKKAVGLLKEMSADDSIRMLYEQREMVLRDIESFKDDARLDEREIWKGVVAEKDAVIADKDAEIAYKDAAHAAALADKDAAYAAALADKDAKIAELLALFGK